MSHVKVTYEYSCFVNSCDATHEDTWFWLKGAEFPEPTAPEGWAELATHYFCPDHDLTLFIDDLEVNIL